MNRREFVAGAAALAAASRLHAQGASSAALTFGAKAGSAVPADFAGLSYESAQLANPSFFSPANKGLINLFRELAPVGNLRIGGGSSEFTTFSDTGALPGSPVPFEVFGPDTSKTVKKGTVTTALALHNLRGFLEAVNWGCLYGLNLGQGTVENAVSEARAAYSILGPRLIAFQIGNEPDSFRNRYRPATYTPDDYIAEWLRFHDAIHEAVPDAQFAGPDISNKLAYLTAFAAMAPKHPDIVLLTSHYYAMGPASNPEATLDNLLDPDPKLTTLKRRDLHIIQEARETAHLPYRMSEGNSCWDGGKPGVSDTFASALWAAGYMMECMRRGWAGVNFHGGGRGFYTPIAGAPSTGFEQRPEFFGIQFAQRFAGAKVIETTLTGASPRIDAYAFEHPGGHRELAVVNKTPDAFTCALPAGTHGTPQASLIGPAIDAKDEISVRETKGKPANRIDVPGYTATVFRL
jgi:hypothetical protein